MVKKISSSLTFVLCLVVFKVPQLGADLLHELHSAGPPDTELLRSGGPRPAGGVEFSPQISGFVKVGVCHLSNEKKEKKRALAAIKKTVAEFNSEFEDDSQKVSTLLMYNTQRSTTLIFT